MRLAGVDDRPALRAEQRDQRARPSGRWPSSRATSLPSAVAEAAGLDEVALHVDDDQRDVRRDRARSRTGGREPETRIASVPRHVLADGVAVGVLDRRDVGDRAARHHRDAVGRARGFRRGPR